ncbi:hypothetical protein HBI04_052090 [Parastagonospora nodorum]|nr:hypothetical protein HBI13_015200 [Parastagonospora nodorum]KAH4047292.1 hypothetical protein HBH49_172240 [Parastagonospora nodorum]KAH4097811.1 hypothetical protein HBH48_024310 [Parastagonospora nodorum]KAH4209054.1 hypothetical protein HBI95_084750 [Parastagonospora nodorum]KAH4281042.1 hypothetical protein HBI04_052090 [Parastagonospora nodorum]
MPAKVSARSGRLTHLCVVNTSAASPVHEVPAVHGSVSARESPLRAGLHAIVWDRQVDAGTRD